MLNYIIANQIFKNMNNDFSRNLEDFFPEYQNFLLCNILSKNQKQKQASDIKIETNLNQISIISYQNSLDETLQLDNFEELIKNSIILYEEKQNLGKNLNNYMKSLASNNINFYNKIFENKFFVIFPIIKKSQEELLKIYEITTQILSYINIFSKINFESKKIITFIKSPNAEKIKEYLKEKLTNNNDGLIF